MIKITSVIKHLVLTFLFLGIANFSLSAANNSRSDSFDVLHYEISIHSINFGTSSLKGETEITLKPKIAGLNSLKMDLASLTVDSILFGNKSLSFSHIGDLITMDLDSTLNLTDTIKINVFYGGAPEKDPQFGGFYFSNDYAYNLGVGIVTIPHNYGRAWFPCFDNFVEKSTYRFHITTTEGKKALCNGVLVNQQDLGGDTTLFTWELMNHPIPTYLASMAVSNYTDLNLAHNGIENSIPIRLTAKPADTADMRASFINLGQAIDAFEEFYGAHPFDNIGYTVVPFSGGAMEHATNIAYPLFAVNGNLDNETLYAHELAHHWWGDNVTCKTAGDMWINEGIARFSEHLFTEKVYGPEAYKLAIRQNMFSVLNNAHISDSGFLTLSGIAENKTYSSHTYNKGGAVTHNLRRFLGDSVFKLAMKSILTTHAFDNLDAQDFMNDLDPFTNQNVEDFFDNWIFNPGYSHFSVDSMEITSVGPTFSVNTFIRQKLYEAPQFHESSPIEITYFSSDKVAHTATIVGGEFDTVLVLLDFKPTHAIVNYNNYVNQAAVGENLHVTQSGFITVPHAKINVNVSSVVDSASLFVEHHWVSPDKVTNNPKIGRLSNSHYWTIYSRDLKKLEATATIQYRGTDVDADLIGSTRDSLILVYRPNVGATWREHPKYTLNAFGPIGNIKIDSLINGDYAFANGRSTVGIRPFTNNSLFRVYPNPTSSYLSVEQLEKSDKIIKLAIYDIGGRMVKSIPNPKNLDAIYVGNFKPGQYLLEITSSSQKTSAIVIQINR